MVGEECPAEPAAAEAWSGLATVRWERGEFEQAVTCMERVREADPQLADERLYVLADSLMNLGREREAIALLEARGRVGTLSPPGLLVLGQACLQAEDYENARRHLAAALAANPRLTNAHYAPGGRTDRFGPGRRGPETPGGIRPAEAARPGPVRSVAWSRARDRDE